MAEYCIGRYTARAIEDEPGIVAWQPPPGMRGVSLRPVTQCGPAQLGDVGGVGFFYGPSVAPGIPDYLNLGSDLDGHLSAAQRAAWQSLAGDPAMAVQATTVREALAETVTERSDPLNETAVPTFLPTRAGSIEVHLAGHSRVIHIRGIKPGHRLWPKVRDAYRESYGQLMRQNENVARRALGHNLDQFGIDRRDWRELVPPPGSQRHRDIPRRPPHPHATSQSDTFDRGGDEKLSDGAWEHYATGGGTDEIWSISDQARKTVNDSKHTGAKYTGGALSSHNHKSGWLNETGWSNIGPCSRWSGLSVFTCYSLRPRGTAQDCTLYLFQTGALSIPGSFANSGTTSNGAGQRYDLQSDGTTHTVLENGVQLGDAITDGTLQAGYVFVGVRCFQSGRDGDTWIATDDLGAEQAADRGPFVPPDQQPIARPWAV